MVETWKISLKCFHSKENSTCPSIFVINSKKWGRIIFIGSHFIYCSTFYIFSKNHSSNHKFWRLLWSTYESIVFDILSWFHQFAHNSNWNWRIIHFLLNNIFWVTWKLLKIFEIKKVENCINYTPFNFLAYRNNLIPTWIFLQAFQDALIWVTSNYHHCFWIGNENL